MTDEDRPRSWDNSLEKLVGYPWGTAPPGWTGAYNGQNERTTFLAGPPMEAWGGEKNWVPVSKDRWVWHELVSRFDFEQARRDSPAHWSEDGWPAGNSTWQAIAHAQFRVRVVGRSHDSPFDAVAATIHWAGAIDGLFDLFNHWRVPKSSGLARIGWGTIALDSFDPDHALELGKHGVVLHVPGIDRGDGRRDATEPTLDVKFERAMFGGPDTWRVLIDEELPFFEPAPDWEDQAFTNPTRS